MPPEPHDHALKTALVDVVAQPGDQRAVEILLALRQRLALARLGMPAGVRGDEAHRHQPGLPERRAYRDLALGIQHQRTAVEHQLVLAADGVDVDHRPARLAGTGGEQPLALGGLVEMERRGVERDQDIGAGLRRLPDRGAIPQILADQDAEPRAGVLDHQRLGAGLEVTILVEHLIVGQRLLGVLTPPFSSQQHAGEVVALAVAQAGIPHHDQGLRRKLGDLLRHLRQRLSQARLHRLAQQQVFRRIAGEIELAEYHHVGVVLELRLAHGLDRRCGIAGDIADQRVELCHYQGQVLHGSTLSRQLRQGWLAPRNRPRRRHAHFRPWPRPGKIHTQRGR